MDLIKKVMGSVQAKNSKSSPAKGLAKLKTENEHVGTGMLGQRRSTGQRYNERELGGGRIRRPELPVVPERSDEGKVINGDGKRDLQWGNTEDGEVVDGWPKWLIDNVPREALEGLVPKSAESYHKIDKVGHGTYSNVYKARDKDTGKIVALKKVRFDTSEPKSVKFMAREIMILQKLDHPNVIKLEGLATSRMQYSLYLVFDFMQSDLVRVISQPDGRLTEPQVKCYIHQLLSGLQHCHERGILHRDIKGSNLLIDKNGMLKIADFGLANYFSPNQKRPLTSRVVTLWYRAPELLLGTTNYGVGIDLWSAGCLLAEMFAGRPIMPGRTEVEQLHRIFKLCGAPSEDYWKKLKLSTTFRPPAYRPCLFEAFQDFPESSFGLLTTLLALDPAYRGSASSALQNEFFTTSPLACDLSGLPVIYNKDDDSTATIESRKNRRSRMKHPSKTYCKRKTKDQASEPPKQENVPNNEEPEEKIVELDVQSHLAFGCTSSASSSAKQSSHVESLPFLISPIGDSHQRMPLITPDHPNAGKNIKNQPPLPASKMLSNNYDDNADSKYKLNQVHRSASTREFIKLNTNKDLEALYI